MTIGQRIKIARLIAGMKQTDLAEKSGFSQVTISAYENDCRAPNVYSLEAIAQVLGVSPAYLAGWERNEEIDGKTKTKAKGKQQTKRRTL